MFFFSGTLQELRAEFHKMLEEERIEAIQKFRRTLRNTHWTEEKDSEVIKELESKLDELDRLRKAIDAEFQKAEQEAA